MGGKTWHDNVLTVHIKGVTERRSRKRCVDSQRGPLRAPRNAAASGSPDPRHWLSLFLQTYTVGEIRLDPGPA